MRLAILLTPAVLIGCQPSPAPVNKEQPNPVTIATPPRLVKPTEITPSAADFVLVDKSDRTLSLYYNGALVKTYYGIGFGDAPVGHKRFEGDERTPEGRYTIDTRNPNSAYHLSLRISYPNANDRAYAQSLGRDPGGDIFIHGQPNNLTSGRLPGDWTDGCIAVSNAEITEIWNAVPDGALIEIRP